MSERKIIILVLVVLVYGLYNIHLWFVKEAVEERKVEIKAYRPEVIPKPKPEILITNNDIQIVKRKAVRRKLTLSLKNACTALEIFFKKPPVKCKKMKPDENANTDSPSITVIGITVFLVVLALNAVLDVIKVKEEERARRKENPEGYRRQSLSEFANKKSLRRDSSKFGLNLFQISEGNTEAEKERKTKKNRPFPRGDSTNSYLSEKKNQGDGLAPFCTANESPTGEPRVSKRQSASKLIGARPVPMVRRSSFPALPLNPEVQAMMLQGHHSTDSDDEADGKGRRVRIIRRY